MGVSTHGLFGAADNGQPATPGSYGLAPSGHRLPDSTKLGPVSLQVADLDRSLAWYEGVLGLHRLGSEAGRDVLGSASGRPLVELVERRGVRPVPHRGRTGLFHYAILLPDRPALGRFLRHLGDLGAQAGAADHLVSEALYLHDLDNLGIEVYVDRPRDRWRRVGRELMMATDPLDVDGLLAAGADEPWSGAPAGTVMGHVHLHVNDLDLAAAFYGDGLGFDRTVWGYPGALFLAAGGYHHHLGTNLWAGAKAQPPAADESQLLAWTVELPDAASVEQAAESLERLGHPAVRTGGGEVSVVDPWGTRVRLRRATLV